MKKNRLIIQGGARDGLSVDLPSPPATLSMGRGSENEIQFDPHRDKLVGRKHARVEVRRDGVYLVDENSANGTFRLSAKDEVAVLPEAKVRDGDRFRLGPEGAPFVVFELVSATTEHDSIPPTLTGAESDAPGHARPPSKPAPKPGRMGDTLVGAPPKQPQPEPKREEPVARSIENKQPPASVKTAPAPKPDEAPLHSGAKQSKDQSAQDRSEERSTKERPPEPRAAEPPSEPSLPRQHKAKGGGSQKKGSLAEYGTQGIFIAVVLLVACLIGLWTGFSGVLSYSPPTAEETPKN